MSTYIEESVEFRAEIKRKIAPRAERTAQIAVLTNSLLEFLDFNTAISHISSNVMGFRDLKPFDAILWWGEPKYPNEYPRGVKRSQYWVVAISRHRLKHQS